MFRRFSPLLVVVALALAVAPAWAADKGVAPKSRPRPLPAAKVAEVLTLAPIIRLAPVSANTLPAPLSSGAGFNAGALASNGLASGGRRSTLPVVSDPAAQCRTTCAHARITCDAQDASPECSSRWAMCAADCGH